MSPTRCCSSRMPLINQWWEILQNCTNPVVTPVVFFFFDFSRDSQAAVSHGGSAFNYSTSIFHSQHLLGLLHCHYDLRPLPRSHVKKSQQMERWREHFGCARVLFFFFCSRFSRVWGWNQSSHWGVGRKKVLSWTVGKFRSNTAGSQVSSDHPMAAPQVWQ